MSCIFIQLLRIKRNIRDESNLMKRTAYTGLLVFIILNSFALLQAEPIPEAVLKCVCYITISNPKSTPEKPKPNIPIGTAFIVNYVYQDIPDSNKLFIVTARHVLFNSEGQRFPKLFLRMNRKEGGELQDFVLPNISNWILHPDKSSDIAVYPGVPKQAKYLTVSNSMFLNDRDVKERAIGIGDEVFFVGLLPYHSGYQKITPIVRFGKLALVTNEKTIDDKYYHFIDADNLPGHSGSPLFLWATPSRKPGAMVLGQRIFKLYGIVSGVVEYPKPLKIAKTTKSEQIPIDYRSGGVTSIVPVRYLEDLLNSDKVREAVGLPPRKIN